jgi:hypothetical protein
MRCFVLLYLFFGFLVSAYAQVSEDTFTGDTNYLEDQFYIGITYNFLLDKPVEVSQRNLSYGLQTGFIKDIPINTDRTVALGIGIGYNVNSYYSNLRATESGSDVVYDILDGDANFKRSKVETHLIEVPLEFRWRNSTATSYKFWRVYTGLRFGYVVGGRSKFVSDLGNFSFYNDDIRKFQYGLTFNFGYNTFNIHLYYSLINLFNDDVLVSGNQISMKPLRIGLIFYIL